MSLKSHTPLRKHTREPRTPNGDNEAPPRALCNTFKREFTTSCFGTPAFTNARDIPVSNAMSLTGTHTLPSKRYTSPMCILKHNEHASNTSSW